MAVNDKLARVFVSHPSQVRCIKASEIQDSDKDLILNQFLKKQENINLGDLKEGFISFKDLKATSKIFKEGGFLEKIGIDGKDYANSGGVFFYNKDKLNNIKGILEDDEKVCIHPVVRLCLTNISVNGEKDTTDITTFCGFTQTLSPTAKYNVSIGSNLEIMDNCEDNGFYDLLFKEFFNTFDYDKNLPNGFIKQANAEDFLWILNFQSKGEGCVCNHWLTFKAKITGAGITRDATNPISDFSPNLAVQGGIAHEKNCSPMVIFGDKEEKKDDKKDPDPEPKDEKTKYEKWFDAIKTAIATKDNKKIKDAINVDGGTTTGDLEKLDKLLDKKYERDFIKSLLLTIAGDNGISLNDAQNEAVVELFKDYFKVGDSIKNINKK